MKGYIWLGAVAWLGLAMVAPARTLAGGGEYPGHGARSLGRGGTNLSRADDPHIMLRNPALLADLWGNQAYLNWQVSLPDACFQPSGAYGWGISNSSAADFGGDPVNQNSIDEPYPEVCYEGGPVLLPSLAFSFKPTERLGFGIGFLPPNSTSTRQWGNRQANVQTENGLRPAPTRYITAHVNTSYFTLMGSAGYRLADWIRVGAGFKWDLLVLETDRYSNQFDRAPTKDNRSELLVRDLFMPSFVASVHLVPHDNLDITFAFRWMDRFNAENGDLQLTSGAWGTGEPVNVDGTTTGSSIPTTRYVNGSLEIPPIVTPKLSFGLRYADRVEPRTYAGSTGEGLPEGTVKDSMETENWDIEFNVVYQFNSAYDGADFAIPRSETFQLTEISASGNVTGSDVDIGRCLELNHNCTENHSIIYYGGTDQWSFRLGGDYNVIRGKLAVRGGVSYETRGASPNDAALINSPYERLGVHGGLTWRIDSVTDMTFGYAHFFQESIGVNPYHATRRNNFPRALEDTRAVPADEADGVADVELINGTDAAGPLFVNAGKHSWALDVFALSFARHF